MPNLEEMNLNYLLNKAYYDELEHQHFGKCNKALTEKTFSLGQQELYFTQDSFCLTTTYPGLLIGIGNTHEAGQAVSGDEKDGAEIKLGFTLDYVTGLPIIPGSTVKGVLRSAFKRHPDYAAELLNVNEEAVAKLERAIFEEGVKKVVFFDAIPVKPGKGGRIFGLDNITPHPDPLKSPIPLTMLKVLPNVSFLFRFGFERWGNTCGVDKEKLKVLFRTILTTLGIGAKTNVGYGAMEVGGMCEHPGCDALPPKNRRDGTFHRRCREHRL